MIIQKYIHLARRIWTTDLRMSIWYFQLQSSALPTELSRDALVGRKIRRHKVVPGTDDMFVAKPLRTELHVVYVMTLVLIDLRSVCVFALRNNMLNGKMYSIGSCKRTQAWHPHNMYNIYLSKQSSFYHDSLHTWLSPFPYILLLLLLPFDDHAFYLLHLFYDGQES